MSDTPETDAFTTSFTSIDDLKGKKQWVPSDFARKLERERDEARERLHKAVKVLDDYDQAIKNPSSPFWEAFKKWFTWEAGK